MFIDARKAHLNPRCEEDVYIMLPEECGAPPGMCGKLNFWLYGFRPAAKAWEDLYSRRLVDIGFVRGKCSSVVFYCKARDLALVVHRDDFTVCGEDGDLDWFQGRLRNGLRLRLGQGLGEARETTRRRVSWEEISGGGIGE